MASVKGIRAVAVALVLPLVVVWAMLAAPFSAATPLFAGDDTLQLELRGPLGSLSEDEPDGWHVFQVASGAQSLPVRVKAGGKSRRRVCEFAPLQLAFDSSTVAAGASAAGIFAGQQVLRITRQCGSSARSRADLIEEFLAYRIFNRITDYSYRVRLLQVSYIDTAQPDRRASTAYAFAIEHERELARRIGGKVLELNGLPLQKVPPEHAANVYIFQYLIGNTDWSLVSADGAQSCCHNGQLIGVGAKILYIPYDFDLAGLVNPYYARPDPSLPIERVRQRLYRGFCGPPAALEASLAHIVGRREAIIGLLRDAPGLSAKERDRAISYVEGFFSRAENPGKLLASFIRRCLE